jgi:enoyl-CoA hydratase/carnithine racemase
MTNKLINVHAVGDIAELQLTRPPVNALTPELLAGLRAELAEQPAAGARGLLITGREGLFSAGLDVPYLLKQDEAGMLKLWTEFFSLVHELTTSPVPVAAAVAGHAPAGGAVIALHCDYRVAARGDFRLGLNETTIGLPVPPSIHAALAWTVGRRQAARLVTGGLMLTPDDALSVGLVDELAEVADVRDRSIAYLKSLLALPPVAMNTTRQIARAELIAATANPDEHAGIALQAWFSDETQTCLAELAASIGK